MSERGLHTIEDDLSETWIEDWAAVGLSEMETLLAKHAAFLGFLDLETAGRVVFASVARSGNARRT